MKFCKVCVTPDSRPRIFEENEFVMLVFTLKKNLVNKLEKREEEFLTLVKKIKDEDNSENPYNYLVPWSGGKDSLLLLLNLNLNLV